MTSGGEYCESKWRSQEDNINPLVFVHDKAWDFKNIYKKKMIIIMKKLLDSTRLKMLILINLLLCFLVAVSSF